MVRRVALGQGAARWAGDRWSLRAIVARGHRGGLVFISTFEKQLDAKRRIVAPVDYRQSVAPFDGLFCFPSIEADCIEGGGKALFDEYAALIDEFPLGDPVRTALETCIMGGMVQLSFDTAGRITLPESFCEMFGITDWVTVVGLNNRFQVWPREAYRARYPDQRQVAREGMIQHAAAKRAAKLAGAAA
jgi:MraZ protein